MTLADKIEAPMTDPATIAASLSEAQKRALTHMAKDKCIYGKRPLYGKVIHKLRRMGLAENTIIRVGPALDDEQCYCWLTPIGLAVRRELER